MRPSDVDGRAAALVKRGARGTGSSAAAWWACWRETELAALAAVATRSWRRVGRACVALWMFRGGGGGDPSLVCVLSVDSIAKEAVKLKHR